MTKYYDVALYVRLPEKDVKRATIEEWQALLPKDGDDEPVRNYDDVAIALAQEYIRGSKFVTGNEEYESSVEIDEF